MLAAAGGPASPTAPSRRSDASTSPTQKGSQGAAKRGCGIRRAGTWNGRSVRPQGEAERPALLRGGELDAVVGVGDDRLLAGGGLLHQPDRLDQVGAAHL